HSALTPTAPPRRPPHPFPTRRSSDLGLDTQYSGEVILPAVAGRLELAYVFQTPRLLPWLTAAQNVSFVLEERGQARRDARAGARDRKSTRLNSSHQITSYAVFCLKKK